MDALDAQGLDHVVNKIYDLVNSGGSADYIVEEGTEGIWTFRKWASGVAECWGTKVHTVTSWSAWGNLYEGLPSFTENYPTGLFIEVPVLNMTADGTANNTGTCGLEVFKEGSATAIPLSYVLRPNSTAVNIKYNIHLHARGLWKKFTPSMSDRTYKSFGSYTLVTGTMTTKAWANPDQTTTWTAPEDGLYLISMHIVTQEDTTYTSTYKMFRWFGTATALLEITGLYFRGTTDGAQYGINGNAWTFPVLAKKGQTVSSCIWTGAVAKYNVQICGILVGDYIT